VEKRHIDGQTPPATVPTLSAQKPTMTVGEQQCISSRTEMFSLYEGGVDF